MANNPPSKVFCWKAPPLERGVKHQKAEIFNRCFNNNRGTILISVYVSLLIMSIATLIIFSSALDIFRFALNSKDTSDYYAAYSQLDTICKILTYSYEPKLVDYWDESGNFSNPDAVNRIVQKIRLYENLSAETGKESRIDFSLDLSGLGLTTSDSEILKALWDNNYLTAKYERLVDTELGGVPDITWRLLLSAVQQDEESESYVSSVTIDENINFFDNSGELLLAKGSTTFFDREFYDDVEIGLDTLDLENNKFFYVDSVVTASNIDGDGNNLEIPIGEAPVFFFLDNDAVLALPFAGGNFLIPEGSGIYFIFNSDEVLRSLNELSTGDIDVDINNFSYTACALKYTGTFSIVPLFEAFVRMDEVIKDFGKREDSMVNNRYLCTPILSEFDEYTETYECYHGGENRSSFRVPHPHITPHDAAVPNPELCAFTGNPYVYDTDEAGWFCSEIITTVTGVNRKGNLYFSAIFNLTIDYARREPEEWIIAE